MITGVATDRAATRHASCHAVGICGTDGARGAAGRWTVVTRAEVTARVVAAAAEESTLGTVARRLRCPGRNRAHRARRTTASHIATRQAKPVAGIRSRRTCARASGVLCDAGAIAQGLARRTGGSARGPVAGCGSPLRNWAGAARVAAAARVLVADTFSATRVLSRRALERICGVHTARERNVRRKRVTGLVGATRCSVDISVDIDGCDAAWPVWEIAQTSIGASVVLPAPVGAGAIVPVGTGVRPFATGQRAVRRIRW